MDSLTAFAIFFLVFFAGISYLIMSFCRRWTKGHQYSVLFNTLIFITSFCLIVCAAFYLFIMNLSFER